MAANRPKGLTDEQILIWYEKQISGDSSLQNEWTKTHPDWLYWINFNAGKVAEIAKIAKKAKQNVTNGNVSTNDLTVIPVAIKAPSATISSSNVLKYPSFHIGDNTDYVVFGFYKYDPPFGKSAEGERDGFASGLNSAGYNLYNASGRVEGKTQSFGSVILYMPEDIQGQYSANWSGTGFGAAAAGLGRVAGTEINAIGAALETIPGMLKNAVFKTELDLINKFTGANISLNQFTGTVSGTIVNPNVEMTYESPEMRGFSLQFKLIPNNDTESNVIRNICNRFKKAMLPAFGGQAIFGAFKAPNLLTIPSLCQVTFMSGNEVHPYLPQYKLCAITDVSINYTPDGSYATYGNSSPVATVLKVTFKETKLIFSSEINENGVSF